MTQEPDHRIADDEARRRLAHLCKMTDAMFNHVAPAEGDRMKQAHLAAARGPANNLRLLCEMTDMLRELKAGRPD